MGEAAGQGPDPAPLPPPPAGRESLVLNSFRCQTIAYQRVPCVRVGNFPRGSICVFVVLVAVNDGTRLMEQLSVSISAPLPPRTWSEPGGGWRNNGIGRGGASLPPLGVGECLRSATFPEGESSFSFRWAPLAAEWTAPGGTAILPCGGPSAASAPAVSPLRQPRPAPGPIPGVVGGGMAHHIIGHRQGIFHQRQPVCASQVALWGHAPSVLPKRTEVGDRVFWCVALTAFGIAPNHTHTIPFSLKDKKNPRTVRLTVQFPYLKVTAESRKSTPYVGHCFFSFSVRFYHTCLVIQVHKLCLRPYETVLRGPPSITSSHQKSAQRKVGAGIKVFSTWSLSDPDLVGRVPTSTSPDGTPVAIH